MNKNLQSSEGECPKCGQPLGISGTCYACAMPEVPPVDLLPCGWASPMRVDPDGTMTPDASVEEK